jgi:hypothetical protein
MGIMLIDCVNALLMFLHDLYDRFEENETKQDEKHDELSELDKRETLLSVIIATASYRERETTIDRLKSLPALKS